MVGRRWSCRFQDNHYSARMMMYSSIVWRRVRTAFSPAVLLTLAALTFACAITKFGMRALACAGIDWADHLGAVESFVLDQSREPAGALGDAMLGYPPLAHWLCARVALFTGIATPRALQLFCAAAGFIGCGIVGLKASRLIRELSVTTAQLIVALSIIISSFAVLTYLGLGVFGHVAYNFFFAQFIATIAALIGLEALASRRLTDLFSASCLIQVIGYALVCMHLLPALWFYGSAVLALSAQAKRRTTALLCFSANAAIAVLLLLTNPYFRSMATTANNDGDFVLRTGVLSSKQVMIAIVVGSAISAVALLLLSWLRRGWPGAQFVAVHHAGFIAIVGLMLINTFVFLFSGFSSWYSIKKYLMILAIEGPLALTSIGTLVIQRRASASYSSRGGQPKLNSSSSVYFTAIAVVVLMLAVQIPWGFWNFDQRRLLYYRELLLGKRFDYTSNERAYPNLQSLSPLSNYYLATGITLIPRDARTINWLNAIISGQRQSERTLDVLGVTFPRMFYWYTMQAQRQDGGTALRVHWPYAEHFILTERLPAKPEEVLLGFRVIGANGNVLREERLVLRRCRRFDTADFTAVLPRLQQPNSFVKVDLVQEGVTWFEGMHAGPTSSILLPAD
jgi:hypothetical protein